MARPDPRVDPESLPPAPAPEPEPEPVAPVAPTAPVASLAPRAAPDPRVAKIEPLVARNDWKQVVDMLGPIEDAAKLPPNLGLVAAVAHNELAKDGVPEARVIAIRSMAALLGMPAESELVRVITRRLLRKNPVAFRQRQAPPAKTSFLIIVIVLIVGSATGWFLSSPMFLRLIHH
jgi:fused signal recognition particle receptor